MSLGRVRAGRVEQLRIDSRVHHETCRHSDSLFAAIGACLANGAAGTDVVDEDGRVLGRVTLESLRRAVRAGELFSNAVLGDSIALLRAPANAPSEAAPQDMPLSRPDLTYAELESLLDAFLSTWISGRGPHIEAFERAYADFTRTRHAIAVSSGTAALHLALIAHDIGEGDEVIVPDLTFAATINAVLHAGATPVIADIDRESFGLSSVALKEAVTARTKAVIPVHLYGRPVLSGTIEMARALGLVIIEDCAEAQGATLGGKPVGSLGDIGCFSLFANKLITAGEGGMCVTSNAQSAERIRELRDHGVSCARPLWHTRVGYNYRLTNLQAAIGLSQLIRFGEIREKRAHVDALYRTQLARIAGVRFPAPDEDGTARVTWLSVAIVPPEARDTLIEEAAKDGIEFRPFFHPLSAMPIYRDHVRAPCPNARALSATGLCLPTTGHEDGESVARVTRVFHRVLG